MIEEIEAAYRTALHNVSTNISQFVKNPDSDFSRNRKLGIEALLNYLITNSNESSKAKLLDLCADMDDPPSPQAMVGSGQKSGGLDRTKELYGFSCSAHVESIGSTGIVPPKYLRR